MKSKYFIFLLISGLVPFLYMACDSGEKTIDPNQLCFEFYELNKETNFRDLYYMNIPDVRQHFEYDSKKNKYTIIPVLVGIRDSVNGETYTRLPVFRDGADKAKQHNFLLNVKSRI